MIPTHWLSPTAIENSKNFSDLQDIRFGEILQRELDPASDKNQQIAILGVPQDVGVERNGGRIGSALAPEKIREQLVRLVPSSDWSGRLKDFGNISCSGVELEEIHRRLEITVQELLQIIPTVIVIGGGHDIALSNARALGKERKIAIVNIDAHLDVRPFKDGKCHSGSPFRQFLEDHDISVVENGFVEFGIQREVVAQHHLDFVKTHGGEVMFFADDESLIDRLAKFENLIDNVCRRADSVYLSFDIDSIQSSFAPGVSAPNPSGFSANEALAMVEIAAKNTRVRLIDFVEVNPLYDIDHRTSALVARMIARFIGTRLTQ